MTLTAERLREVLSYDPLTGVFTRIKRTGNGTRLGVTGNAPNSSGYHTIMVDKTLYQAHRLAWLYSYGIWPESMLDHVDEDKSNNRLSNLRMSNDSHNQHNQSRPQSNNKSGFRGVCFHKGVGKFQAQLGYDGLVHHLGYFNTAEEASKVYEKERARFR